MKPFIALVGFLFSSVLVFAPGAFAIDLRQCQAEANRVARAENRALQALETYNSVDDRRDQGELEYRSNVAKLESNVAVARVNLNEVRRMHDSLVDLAGDREKFCFLGCNYKNAAKRDRDTAVSRGQARIVNAQSRLAQYINRVKPIVERLNKRAEEAFALIQPARDLLAVARADLRRCGRQNNPLVPDYAQYRCSAEQVFLQRAQRIVSQYQTRLEQEIRVAQITESSVESRRLAFDDQIFNAEQSVASFSGEQQARLSEFRNNNPACFNSSFICAELFFLRIELVRDLATRRIFELGYKAARPFNEMVLRATLAEAVQNVAETESDLEYYLAELARAEVALTRCEAGQAP